MKKSISNTLKIDPEIQKTLDIWPELDFREVAAVRAYLKEKHEEAVVAGTVPTDDRVMIEERLIPGTKGGPEIRVRIYSAKARSEVGPGVVLFHGGGFMVGDLETEHLRCLRLVGDGGAVVVTPEYRLAPEHPFPAGVEDCYATLCWTAANAVKLQIDSAKIAVGGGSAGGALSAAVAQMARDRGGPSLAFQLLAYPVIDDRMETYSMKNGMGLPIWDTFNTELMWNYYLGDDRAEVSPYAAPGRATDLANLPPAYVMTAEHDPLRDEALEYATRLMQAGIPVELHHYPATVHAFDILTPSVVSTAALNEQVAVFRRVMGQNENCE